LLRQLVPGVIHVNEATSHHLLAERRWGLRGVGAFKGMAS
jgi:hypothetical protein